MADKETVIRAIIVSFTRADINPIIKVEKLKRLMESEFNLSIDQIRERTTAMEERQALNRVLTVLEQPKEILDFLGNGFLSEGHAVFLNMVRNVTKRIRMAKKAVKQGWNLDTTWHKVQWELDPQRRRAKLKQFERSGFDLSWNDDEIEIELRPFNPAYDTVEEYVFELQKALEFVLDDNEIDLEKFARDDEPAEPPPPMHQLTGAHAAAEVAGKPLQVPAEGVTCKGKVSHSC